MTLPISSNVAVQDNGEPLVELSSYGFFLEPMYYLQGFSGDPRMYLRKSVADRLAFAEKSLPSNLRFKIWDGWRSRAVQDTIYQHFYAKLKIENPDWDEQMLVTQTRVFVSPATDPKVVPPHSTGGAVDLTLANAAGDELEMGTAFDHLGPESALLYYEENDLNPEIRANRKLLRETMVNAGFATYEGEWWDFNFGNHYWAAVNGKATAFYGEIEKLCTLELR